MVLTEAEESHERSKYDKGELWWIGGEQVIYKTYEEYKKIAYENVKKRREQLDSIILNNELYKKALLECERRKKNNLNIFKTYEIT